MAWGIFETMRRTPERSGFNGFYGLGAGFSRFAMPPLPNVGSQASAVSPETMRIVRLAISAANADGSVSDAERAAILDQAKTAGVGDVVEAEMQQPRPLAEIVSGVSDAGQRATMYVLAYSMVRGDEQPSGAERIYLAQLANLLGIDVGDGPAARSRTPQAVSRRNLAGRW